MMRCYRATGRPTGSPWHRGLRSPVFGPLRSRQTLIVAGIAGSTVRYQLAIGIADSGLGSYWVSGLGSPVLPVRAELRSLRDGDP